MLNSKFYLTAEITSFAVGVGELAKKPRLDRRGPTPSQNVTVQLAQPQSSNGQCHSFLLS